MALQNPIWLITGAGGQLGSILLRELSRRGENVLGLVSPTGPRPSFGKTSLLDLTDTDALRGLLNEFRPTCIIHAAAITSIQAACEDPDLARRVNVEATAALAEAGDKIGVRLVYISTDLVFDGTAAPYSENSPPSPLSVYGRTKADAELRALAGRRSGVIRLPLMYGIPAVRRGTTFLSQLEAIREGRPLKLFQDEFRTPLYLEDAARACIEVARSEFTGIIHAAGPERLSRYEMGLIAAASLSPRERPALDDSVCCQGAGVRAAGYPNLIPINQSDIPAPEPRPRDVSLDSSLYTQTFGHPAGRPMSEAMEEIARDIV